MTYFRFEHIFNVAPKRLAHVVLKHLKSFVFPFSGNHRSINSEILGNRPNSQKNNISLLFVCLLACFFFLVQTCQTDF